MSRSASLSLRYRYDALDRLVASSSLQRFYRRHRLSTEIDGAVSRSLFEHAGRPLAQRTDQVALLATEAQGSVTQSIANDHRHALAYSPYGHRSPTDEAFSLLGFNGERPDPLTGHYLLGNGYRAFNPVLMRFTSPDSWSPFGRGGLNPYGYCNGDPINLGDPSGHAPLGKLLGRIGRLFRGKKVATPVARARSTTEIPRTPPLQRARSEPAIAAPQRQVSRPNQYTSEPIPAVLETSSKDAQILQLRDTFYNGEAGELKSLMNKRHEQGLPLNESRAGDLEAENYLHGQRPMSPELRSDVEWAHYLYGSRQVNGKTFKQRLTEIRYGFNTNGDVMMPKPFRGEPRSQFQRPI